MFLLKKVKNSYFTLKTNFIFLWIVTLESGFLNVESGFCNCLPVVLGFYDAKHLPPQLSFSIVYIISSQQHNDTEGDHGCDIILHKASALRAQTRNTVCQVNPPLPPPAQGLGIHLIKSL
jgi:hypothetical protein